MKKKQRKTGKQSHLQSEVPLRCRQLHRVDADIVETQLNVQRLRHVPCVLLQADPVQGKLWMFAQRQEAALVRRHCAGDDVFWDAVTAH